MQKKKNCNCYLFQCIGENPKRHKGKGKNEQTMEKKLSIDKIHRNGIIWQKPSTIKVAQKKRKEGEGERSI